MNEWTHRHAEVSWHPNMCQRCLSQAAACISFVEVTVRVFWIPFIHNCVLTLLFWWRRWRWHVALSVHPLSEPACPHIFNGQYELVLFVLREKINTSHNVLNLQMFCFMSAEVQATMLLGQYSFDNSGSYSNKSTFTCAVCTKKKNTDPTLKLGLWLCFGAALWNLEQGVLNLCWIQRNIMTVREFRSKMCSPVSEWVSQHDTDTNTQPIKKHS